MALASHNKEDLQKSLEKLTAWTDKNGLNINKEKSALMIFRKGGRTTDKDNIYIRSDKRQRVSSYEYRGVTWQTACSSFQIRVTQKAIAALDTVCEISQVQ